MNDTQDIITLYVEGMHCRACEVLIEDTAREHGATQAHVQRSRGTLELSGSFEGRTSEELAQELTAALADHGYRFSTTPPVSHVTPWRELLIALAIACSLMGAFFVLQTFDIVSMVRIDTMSYGAAFLIGIVASLSTCMAVVGGLVLSLSATFSRIGASARPMIAFHAARLGSFFVLGGVLGAAGSLFSISHTMTSILGIVVGVIMFALGIQMIGVLPGMRLPVLSLRTPTDLRRFSGTYVTPIVAGAMTFFLPCGFTQSMQFYTLTVQSATEGALTMLAFALGTLPVLAALSFGAYRIRSHAWSGVLFKTMGFLIMGFALFTIVTYLPL